MSTAAWPHTDAAVRRARFGLERQEPDRRLRLGLDLASHAASPHHPPITNPPWSSIASRSSSYDSHARRVRRAERERIVEQRALDLVLQRGERRRRRIEADRRLLAGVTTRDRHL